MSLKTTMPARIRDEEKSIAYKKPTIIAQSASKQSFVASCPVKCGLGYCSHLNNMCQVGALR